MSERSISHSNRKDITGEEAFATLCGMAPLSIEEECGHDLSECQKNIQTGHLLPKLEAAEEGEVRDDKVQSNSATTSRATFTLYSIPQWQPPPAERSERELADGMALHHPPIIRPKRQVQPPASDRVLGFVMLPFLTSPVDNRQNARAQGAANANVVRLEDKPIKGIPQHDRLDQRIGIRPRHKTSAEVHFVLRPEFYDKSNLPAFPRAMSVIIHQFMVANDFVCPRRHLSSGKKKSLRKGLLVRLDLHETSNLLAQQRQCLTSAIARLDTYINNRSKEWLDTGIFHQPSPKLDPIFQSYTQAWLRRDWDGVITLPAQMTAIQRDINTATVFSGYDNMKIGQCVDTASLPASRQVTHQQMETVDATKERNEQQKSSTTSRKRRVPDHTDTPAPRRIKGCTSPVPEPSLASPQPELDQNWTASRKRPAPEDADAPAPKHSQEGPRPDADRFLESPQPELDDVLGMEYLRPHDTGFYKTLESIRHAHQILEELAPKSAKDLVALQRDWQHHEYPSTLAEGLFVAQSYTLSMKSYLDNALDLLSFLEDCASWKIESSKLAMELKHGESATTFDSSRTSESARGCG